MHSIPFLYFTAECPNGQYGLGCKKRCTGYCKHNTSCNHVTGLCDLGCADGYIGTLCNKGNEQKSFEFTFLTTSYTKPAAFSQLSCSPHTLHLAATPCDII